jgi:hypothetical protein
MTKHKKNNTSHNPRMVGLIKHVSSNGSYCFVSNVMAVDGDTFLLRTRYSNGDGELPTVGTWVEYDFKIGPRGPVASNATICTLETEAMMERLLSQYGHSMQTNYGSLRLDALTRLEALGMLNRRLISHVEYYSRMSENGLKEAARHRGVSYTPGRQLAVATAIVAAMDESSMVG